MARFLIRLHGTVPFRLGKAIYLIDAMRSAWDEYPLHYYMTKSLEIIVQNQKQKSNIVNSIGEVFLGDNLLGVQTQ